MGKIKNFKLFVEGYSDELKVVLSNEENEYIIIKGENVIAGFEYLEDAFDHLCELLEGDGSISEEQKYEFEDMLSETLPSLDEPDQYEIDEFLSDILDKFNIIEPWSIKNKMELEETPLDPTLDDDWDMDTNKQESDMANDDLDQEYAEMLGESITHEPFCITGKFNGKEEEIDSFVSEEEANEYLPDYKTIYNEFEDIKVSSRIEESKSNDLIFTPTKTEECECIKSTNENADTCDFDCKCQEEGFCSCGEDCDCQECEDMRKGDKVHMAHCDKGKYEGSCKYGSDNCPALRTNEDIGGEYFDEEDFEEDLTLDDELRDVLDMSYQDVIDRDEIDMDLDDELEIGMDLDDIDDIDDNSMDYWNMKDMEEEERKSRNIGIEESKIHRFKTFKK